MYIYAGNQVPQVWSTLAMVGQLLQYTLWPAAHCLGLCTAQLPVAGPRQDLAASTIKIGMVHTTVFCTHLGVLHTPLVFSNNHMDDNTNVIDFCLG